AVAQACGLDDDVDRTDDDLAHRLLRQYITAHGDHGFHAVEALARAVGMDRAHRTVMARIHGLQEIEHFRPAHFADNDAFGTHAQAVLYQIAHGDFAFAFQIGRAGFQTYHMRLLQLQFCRVFAGDDAFVRVDIACQAVQKRGLARAGAPRNNDIAAHPADDLQEFRPSIRYGAEPHQLVERQLVLAELADGEGRAVERQRRRDD